ncbi:MAG: hypothetical protein K6A28_03200, partial [Bacteroidales bacterium]|nr:hypothetical protein [Bacteroidales bacterium]
MKKVFLSLMLLCGIAMISTSCKDNSNETVTPEVQSGTMAIDTKTIDITTADAVNYGSQNAIVLASKDMTAADNEGVAIIFPGDIIPGTYSFDNDSKDPVIGPVVVGLNEFSMGELPFVMNSDTIFFGDAYFWINGELSVTEANGTYTVILSQCVGANANGENVSLALNFNGTLTPYVFDTDNKFMIDNVESPIGLAGITTIDGLSSLGVNIQSMLFMSADHKRSFIVSYVGDESVDGTHELGYLGTPYLPLMPCVHVALDADFWTAQPQT